MNFADVLKGIGLTIVHTAEQAAADPAVRDAVLKVFIAIVAAETAKPKP